MSDQAQSIGNSNSITLCRRTHDIDHHVTGDDWRANKTFSITAPLCPLHELIEIQIRWHRDGALRWRRII